MSLQVARYVALWIACCVVGAVGGCQTEPHACVVKDDRSTCGCAQNGETDFLDPGFTFTPTCTPATITVGPTTVCCALNNYPENGVCECRSDLPTPDCTLLEQGDLGSTWRQMASCAVDDVRSSQ